MKNNEIIEKLDEVGLVGISELIKEWKYDSEFNFDLDVDLEQWKDNISDTLIDIAVDVLDFNEDPKFRFNYLKELIQEIVILYKEVK